MLDYLVKHAVDNVWCSPEQDRQVIIRPKRLSHRLGALGLQQVMWERIKLPTQGDYYHVFQIGHVHPILLGLHGVDDDWVRLDSIINTTTLMAEVYFGDGVVLPRTETWIKYDRHKNLIVAIPDTRIFRRLRDDGIYCRVYSNAYFESHRANATTEGTFIEGLTVSAASDVLTLQQKYHLALVKPGTAYAYHNGWLVNDLRPSRIAVGDKIEYVYDSSIYRTINFPISELGTFDSTLDLKRKYLLNYALFDNERIDFEDDVDIYLVKRDEQGRERGIYYHRNKKDAIRMLSHKDYAIPVSYVDGFQQAHESVWSNMNDLSVRVYVRKAGFDRPLIQEHHRLFELYRLDAESVKRAMLGVDSTVTVWQAAALEASPYVALMRAKDTGLNSLSVQEAYGYNAVSRLVGDTPQAVRVTANGPMVDLKPGHWEETTLYEYSAQGKLLGYYFHASGLEYVCRHPETALVEAVVGEVSESLDMTSGELMVSTDKRYNYRAYLCTRLGDQLLWDWVDVSNSEILSVGGGTLNFTVDLQTDYPTVISDKRFIGYQVPVPVANGVLTLTVSSNETHLGETVRRTMTVPPRRLDLWLNGHPLIEGLDYHVDFPEVVVVNKQYLTNAENQYLDVRCQGFCASDMKTEAPRESGFVEHGYLSKDRQYNVRDDKVVSFIVGGKLTLRSELDFAEDNSGISVSRVANGTPYVIRETIVPMRGETYLDTYNFRARSIAVDTEIEAYLTLKYPEPVIPGPSPILERYAVYSPFLSRIINDLQEGYIDESRLKTPYSNAEVYELGRYYEFLLPFDPANLGVDDRYVAIHPHRFLTPVPLSIYQYNFVQRINALYFDNAISLSQFIEVQLPQTQE